MRLEARTLDLGAGPLHDFRVALRRLRTAFRSFRPWLGDAVRPRHERKLARIASSTNEARDVAVQLAWLATQREALAAARTRPGFELAVSRLEARARSGPGAKRVAERFRRAAGKLRRRLEEAQDPEADAGGPTLGAALAPLLRERSRALARRMDAVRRPADEEAVRRARIAAKRLRYLLEPLAGSRPVSASGTVARLKVLQDLLGDLHDANVLSAELREMLADASAERARKLHASLFRDAAGAAAIRRRLRRSPRPGLLALARLVRERRDALHARLEHERREGAMGALAGQISEIAAALEARPGPPQARRRPSRRAPPARARVMRERTTRACQ